MDQQTLPDTRQNEYGITRSKRKKRFGWTVYIHRQGQRVVRYFDDGACGGKMEAHELAKVWRDEAAKIFPPISNRQQAQKLRCNNKSGVPGVTRLVNKETGKAVWRAGLGYRIPGRRLAKYRSKNYSIEQYGEEEAKALAIAQRQVFLEELKPALFTTSTRHDVAEMSAARFAEHMAVIPQPRSGKWIDRDDVKALLADLNARIDAMMPNHMHVRVKIPNRVGRPRLEASILTTAPPAFQERVFLMEPRQLAEILPEALDFLMVEIANRFGEPSARAFEGSVGEVLHPERFSPSIGFKMELVERRHEGRLFWEAVPDVQP